MTIVRDLATIPLDGGRLCLDFVNTVRNRKTPVLHNYLTDYEQVLAWCERLSIVSASTLLSLRQYAEEHPALAHNAWKTVLTVRETLYAIFVAIARNEVPDDEVNRVFNDYLAKALSNLTVRFMPEVHTIELVMLPNELISPLWPILKSAYDVLATDERQRIKECGECGWVFFDTTKNNRRQWCNPLICGSTTKAKRYYHRKKQEATDRTDGSVR